MLEQLQKHIAIHFSFLSGKKLLLACSGGVDSVVLTHLFQQLGFDISLVHCNFQLRGKQSDLDETFVKTLANQLAIGVFIKRFTTKSFVKKEKQSIQIAARNLRYRWFEKLLTTHNFDYLLTGHHLDDNLETFLINLSRGTGLEGLTGIPPINGKIVRPLLPFSRETILNFAIENNLQWREDKSNAATKYTRNKIRHQIIPVLKQVNPSLLGSFKTTLEHLKESQQMIADHIEKIRPEIMEREAKGLIKIKIEKIKILSNPKAYLYAFLKDFGFTEWDDIHRLIKAQSGKQVFSKTHRLLKDRDFLLLCKIEKSSPDNIFFVEESTNTITNPIGLTIAAITIKKSSENKEHNHIICLDKALLTFPLILRKWKNGDYFYPSKMQGRKKLNHYFRDEKYSILEKENIWLLCSAKQEIIWIIGKRQDNRFMVSHKTKTVLEVMVDKHQLD